MGLTSPRDSYFLVNLGVSGSCRSPAKLPSFDSPGRVSSTSLRARSDPPLPSHSRSLQTINLIKGPLMGLAGLGVFLLWSGERGRSCLWRLLRLLRPRSGHRLQMAGFLQTEFR